MCMCPPPSCASRQASRVMFFCICADGSAASLRSPAARAARNLQRPVHERPARPRRSSSTPPIPRPMIHSCWSPNLIAQHYVICRNPSWATTGILTGSLPLSTKALSTSTDRGVDATARLRAPQDARRRATQAPFSRRNDDAQPHLPVRNLVNEIDRSQGASEGLASRLANCG